MQVNQLSQNATELIFENKYLLISYKTPVALFDVRTGEYLVTEKFWSKTTSRRINTWLDGNIGYKVAQSLLDEIYAKIGAIL